VFADISEGAATVAAILEVRALLLHLCQFLPHQANDLHAEPGLGSHELEKCGAGNELQHAVGLALGTEGVRSGAERCREADYTTGTEKALEDFSASLRQDGEAH
jgi:hypothetical protein